MHLPRQVSASYFKPLPRLAIIYCRIYFTDRQFGPSELHSTAAHFFRVFLQIKPS